MAKKNIFDVQFIGPNLDAMIDSVTQEVAPDKWIKKKNSIINKGLKVGAENMLPKVKSRMRRKSGISSRETRLFRLSKGGWRIGTPTRDDLSSVYPGAKNAKGYYPASMEYGYKHQYSGRKIEGHKAMTDTMDEDRDKTNKVIAAAIRKDLGRKMSTFLNKRRRMLKRQSDFGFEKNRRATISRSARRARRLRTRQANFFGG